MSEKAIHARIEGLIDQWIKASPAERISLVKEKIHLEDMLAKEKAQA
jgi:hypothetical protein